MLDTPTPEQPDLLDSAIEAVPSLADFHDDADAPVGHKLAETLAAITVPADRPTAARDLIQEMVRAGAEGEITPDLLRQELPPEEWTDADYAAAEEL